MRPAISRFGARATGMVPRFSTPAALHSRPNRSRRLPDLIRHDHVAVLAFQLSPRLLFQALCLCREDWQFAAGLAGRSWEDLALGLQMDRDIRHAHVSEF